MFEEFFAFALATLGCYITYLRELCECKNYHNILLYLRRTKYYYVNMFKGNKENLFIFFLRLLFPQFHEKNNNKTRTITLSPPQTFKIL